jgi:His-Xaa-Ser system protein HxsD
VTDNTALADGLIAINFARDVFDIEAIKRAAYRFSDRVTIEIVPEGERFLCILNPNSDVLDRSRLEREFRNEVLDQDLRIRIGKETEPVRNLILSLAFSRTGLQE